MTPEPGGVIERRLRIIVFDAKTGEQRQYEFRVRWRAGGEKRVTGELRESVTGEAGAVVGRITTNWRSFADRLGRFAGPARLAAGPARLAKSLVGDPDPATELSGIEMEIDEVVTGRRISFRGSRTDSRHNQWIVYGAPGDWWARITVFKDGVPPPIQLRHG